MPQYSLINHFENVSKLEVENKLFKRYRNYMKQARIPFTIFNWSAIFAL